MELAAVNESVFGFFLLCATAARSLLLFFVEQDGWCPIGLPISSSSIRCSNGKMPMRNLDTWLYMLLESDVEDPPPINSATLISPLEEFS